MQTLKSALRPGAVVYGIAMIGFGLIAAARMDAVPSLETLPAFMTPAHAIVGIVSALILFGAGGALVSGARVQRAAYVIALLFSLWAIAFQVPVLVAHPANGGLWVGAFEVVAIGAAAWTLTAALVGVGDLSITVRDGPSATLTIARIAFGLSFLAFGASHFMYAAYVESVTPAWIPWHAFWAYAIGVAHVAAGLSFLTRIMIRLASTLLAVMFASWVFIVHTPRALAAHGNPNEWTSLVVAIAMCGAALIFRAVVNPDVRDATPSMRAGRPLRGG